MEDRCLAEVDALHRFFEHWFNGDMPLDGFARCEASLAPGFRLISPEGQLRERQALLDGLRAAHGAEGGHGFAIRVVPGDVRALAPGLWLVTYEEWHRRAGHQRGRLSTALLEEHPDGPDGLVWRHVHETWLPGPE